MNIICVDDYCPAADSSASCFISSDLAEKILKRSSDEAAFTQSAPSGAPLSQGRCDQMDNDCSVIRRVTAECHRMSGGPLVPMPGLVTGIPTSRAAAG